MSTPLGARGQRGGASVRGGRGTSNQTGSKRDSSRGGTTVRARGRGRGGVGANAKAGSTGAEGLLHKLREGTAKRGADSRTNTTGRGRGAGSSQNLAPGQRGRGRGGFANKSVTFSSSTPLSTTPPPGSGVNRDFMNSKFSEFQTLKQSREEERAKAIRNGFLADPEKKTSLDKAITPVGTCTDMCPRFERVERIVQNMVDRAEKEHDHYANKDFPAEERMVKRFRRSAAGYDEQLPSDIRTPATLKWTLDYLLDKIIDGADRLATVQKFVWDRTRGIRNDFSIQQVTKASDVKLAVECFEHIARFHIVSLHQLSNPDNLLEEEHFDAFQEREQLNNTLLSLMYYYDDHRDRIDFPNEAEFRAYLIIFEIESQKPDIEDRMQSWSGDMLEDPRVKTALQLYAAATNPVQPLGPLHPFEPAAIAQSNAAGFWKVVASKSVPYVMACLAEHFFAHVRFGALDALWRSAKQGPMAQQVKSRDWTLPDISGFLAFDSDEQTREFCAAFEVSFAIDNDSGEEYLDLTANTAKALDSTSTPRTQIFSYKYVESKRYRRTLAAAIKGMKVAAAIRSYATESQQDEEREQTDLSADDDDQTLFVPEAESNAPVTKSSPFGAGLDPTATTFKPSFGNPTTSSPFGKPAIESPFGNAPLTSGFGIAPPQNPFGLPQPKPESAFGLGTGTGGFGLSPAPSVSASTSPFGKAVSLGGFASSSTVFSPSVTASPFGRPASSGGLIADKTIPAGATSSLGQQIQQAQPGAVAAGGFGLFKTPSTWTFTPPAAQQKEESSSSGTPPPAKDSAPGPPPVATFFGKGFESISVASSAPPSAPIFKPNFGQATPAQQSVAPTLHPPLDKSPQFVLPPSAVFGFPQTTQVKSATSSLPPLDSIAPPSHPTQPILVTKPSSQFFNKTTLDSSTQPSGPELTSFKPQIVSENTTQPSLQIDTSHRVAEPQQNVTRQSAPNSLSAASPPLLPSPQPSQSTTPPSSTRQSPAKPIFSEADRRKLASNVARIGLTQPNGLLQSYVEFALREVLTVVFKHHQRELRDAAIASIRRRILARKFGQLWRQRAWSKNLSRRAKTRRQLFAETIRAEQARKHRSKEELGAILKAAQESNRLRQEIEEAVKTPKKPATVSHTVGLIKVAGQKRKSFNGQELRPNTIEPSTGAASISAHKRSKTMSTTENPNAARQGSPLSGFRVSTAQPSPNTSIFSRSSAFGHSTDSSNLRKSMSSQKLDATRTDYFRLKAMGVDPDTPIVPDTKESLALRQRREAEERQASINRASRRVRTPASDDVPPISMPPPSLSHSRMAEVQPSPSKASTPAIVEDDFLKQIREAREAIAEQTDWFKEQAGALEKEIEQEEEFRRSQSSREGASPLSSSGLARANGYEYLAAETKPGGSLSRTERRIRQTGAHGLATKPLRSSSDYVAVAMSKRSAFELNRGLHSPSGRKRSYDDVEPSRETAIAHKAALHTLKRYRAVPHHHQPGMQPKSKPMPAPATRNGNQNPYQLLQSIDPDDDEARDLGEDDDTDELFDEEEDMNDPQSGHYFTSHMANGQYAEGDEEDDLEGDDTADNDDYDSTGDAAEEDAEEEHDDEEVEEEEEEDNDGTGYPYPNTTFLQGHAGAEDYDDAATPASNPQISRAASSAPGGSVDDAFVIDDDSD